MIRRAVGWPFFAILAVLLVAGLGTGCEALPQPASALPTVVLAPPPTPTISPDRVYTVGVGMIQEVITVRGRVASAQEALLSFPARGNLKAIDIREGDAVQKDAVLAELNPETNKAQPLQDEIVDEGFQLRLKRLELDQARAEPLDQEILRAKTDLKVAQVNVQGAQAAWDKIAWRGDAVDGGPEALALQRAQLAVEAAQASYDAAVARKDPAGLKIQYLETQAEYAQAKLERAQSRLGQVAEENLLKAPFDGIIVSVDKRVGDPVAPYETIITLADPLQIRVEVNVLEADMSRVRFAAAVSLTLDASPGQWLTGQVAGISSRAVSWQGKNAYPVTIEFDDPAQVPATIRMGADVSIVTQRVENALLVPTEAIRADGERRYVEVLGGAAPTRVEIETGLTNGPLTEVVWGLAEGDQVKIR